MVGRVCRSSVHISALVSFSARAGHHVCLCIRGAAPLHRRSPAARETAAVRQSLSEQEEERLACRRPDISSCRACRCCAHFLQLFPAVSCSEGSAGVEEAPPSIIILPSPATLPPSADNRTSPRVPSAFALTTDFGPSWSLTPCLFSSFMIFTSFYSQSVPPPWFAFIILSPFTFSVVLHRTLLFLSLELGGSVTLRPFVEAAADLCIAGEAPHTHRCLCRPIPFIRTTLSNFEPKGGLMCVRKAV